MALELTEEMMQQLKEACIATINKSAEGKRKKRIFSKSDLAMNCLFANNIELGKAIASASVEDVNETLTMFCNGVSGNPEEIKKLQEEEATLHEQLKEVKKKLNSLKPSKKNAINIKVK